MDGERRDHRTTAWMRSTACGSRWLRLEQVQLREEHWVIDLVGKGGRLRTVPVPAWCKSLVDTWLQESSVSNGRVFRRLVKNEMRHDEGVAPNVVWCAVK